ncbi:hypothetical protein L9F63_014189, partial [Diploptera punctata]
TLLITKVIMIINYYVADMDIQWEWSLYSRRYDDSSITRPFFHHNWPSNVVPSFTRELQSAHQIANVNNDIYE